MRRLLCCVGFVAVLAVCGQATAQAQGVESLGEKSPVMACFYECKPGPVVQGVATWREVTTLMLANLGPIDDLYGVLFFDGHQRIIAVGFAPPLSVYDLDEVNVCRTLQAAGIAVPQAGLIAVSNLRGAGIYGWVKNLLGRFFVTENEPFNGRVEGIAKTECRLVPPSVSTPGDLVAKINAQARQEGQVIPQVDLIVIEGTAE